MTDILADIYYNRYEIGRRPDSDHTYRNLLRDTEDIREKIGEFLSEDELDKLATLSTMEDLRLFREGFRLGASLMLELIRT